MGMLELQCFSNKSQISYVDSETPTSYVDGPSYMDGQVWSSYVDAGALESDGDIHML